MTKDGLFAFGCLCLCLYLLISLSQAHDCLHDEMDHNPVPVQQLPVDFSRKSFSKLKFDVRYNYTYSCSSTGQIIQRMSGCGPTLVNYTCQSDDVLTADKLAQFQGYIISSAVQFWEYSLSVQAASSLVVESSMCCGLLPPTLTSSSSFVMLVSFSPTNKDSNGNTMVLGWTSACQYDATTGRPTVAHINFGPNGLAATRTWLTDQQNVMTATHEMAHGLGFSYRFFSQFKQLNASGVMVSKPESEVIGIYTENNHTVVKVITPTVAQKVLEQFNCPSLTHNGAELENGGGTAVGASHWEKRLFNYDLMIPILSRLTVVSPLTLALFADSGWYEVTFDHPNVQRLSWGKDAGCSFAQDRCSSWPAAYFCQALNCSSLQRYSCTHNHRARAYCTLTTFPTPLPTHYQYFSNSQLGGGEQLMDYCPVYEDGVLCQDTTNGNNSVTSEFYASDSRCFMSSATMTGQLGVYVEDCGHQIYTTCHRTACINENAPGTFLRIFFGSANSNYIDCPPEGSVVSNLYNALLASQPVVCADVANWADSSGRTCSTYKASGCFSFSDNGQFRNCNKTCGTCVPYNGTLTCPPVKDVCSITSSTTPSASVSPSRSPSSSASSSASVSHVTLKAGSSGMSSGSKAGIAIGVIVSVMGLGAAGMFVFYKRRRANTTNTNFKATPIQAVVVQKPQPQPQSQPQPHSQQPKKRAVPPVSHPPPITPPLPPHNTTKSSNGSASQKPPKIPLKPNTTTATTNNNKNNKITTKQGAIVSKFAQANFQNASPKSGSTPPDRHIDVFNHKL